MEAYILYDWIPPDPPRCFSDLLLHNWWVYLKFRTLLYCLASTWKHLTQIPRDLAYVTASQYSFIHWLALFIFMYNYKLAKYRLPIFHYILTLLLCMCNYRCHSTLSEALECLLLCVVAYTLPQPDLDNCSKCSLQSSRSYNHGYVTMHRLTQFISHPAQIMATMRGLHPSVVSIFRVNLFFLRNMFTKFITQRKHVYKVYYTKKTCLQNLLHKENMFTKFITHAKKNMLTKSNTQRKHVYKKSLQKLTFTIKVYKKSSYCKAKT